MIYVRCKCGECQGWTTDGFQDCQGCTKCETTFASNPEHHKPLQPHDWKTKYNENTGKPYKTCKVCHEIDEESYKKSNEPEN